MFLDAFPSSRSYFRGLERIGQEKFQRLRKAIDVSGRHQQARGPVFHNVRDSPTGCADHRFGIGHGFEKNEAKTFAPAGQGEDITVCVTGEKLFRSKTVKKVGLFGNPEAAGELFEARPVVPIAHQDEGSIGRDAKDVGKSGN